MKVGLSYGRCIRDIVKGDVDIEDVLIIVTKTALPSRAHIENMVEIYMYESAYLRGLDRDKCVSVAKELWDQGKIYQPRMSMTDELAVTSKFMSTGKHGDVWCDLVPSYTGGNTMVEEAFNNYLMLRKLSE